MTLRPSVTWFSEKMEMQLQAHDHKGGWDEKLLWDLFDRMDEEMQELSNSLIAREKIIENCADVACYAMMIAENYSKSK